MKKLIIILIGLICLISSASALTISGNISYNKNIVAGDQDSFRTMFSVDHNEISANIDSISITGNEECKEFITVDKSKFFIKEPVYNTIYVNIPKNTMNGLYSCQVAFLTPTEKSMSAGIGIPVNVNVTGGLTPVITLEPTLTPQVFDTPNEVKEIVIPVKTPTPVRTAINVSYVHNEIPVVNAWTFAGLGVTTLAVTMITLLIYKRKNKNEEVESISLP